MLHKYHAALDALDNDAFMVVGQIRRNPGDDAAIRNVIAAIREQLAARSADVVVDASSQRIVSYVDPSLPLDTSTALRIADALAQNP